MKGRQALELFSEEIKALLMSTIHGRRIKAFATSDKPGVAVALFPRSDTQARESFMRWPLDLKDNSWLLQAWRFFVSTAGKQWHGLPSKSLRE